MGGGGARRGEGRKSVGDRDERVVEEGDGRWREGTRRAAGGPGSIRERAASGRRRIRGRGAATAPEASGLGPRRRSRGVVRPAPRPDSRDAGARSRGKSELITVERRRNALGMVRAAEEEGGGPGRGKAGPVHTRPSGMRGVWAKTSVANQNESRRRPHFGAGGIPRPSTLSHSLTRDTERPRSLCKRPQHLEKK